MGVVILTEYPCCRNDSISFVIGAFSAAKTREERRDMAATKEKSL
jgi:hypothetical protein